MSFSCYHIKSYRFELKENINNSFIFENVTKTKMKNHRPAEKYLVPKFQK